jgi:cob(I)alamin adenosyltransferase
MDLRIGGMIAVVVFVGGFAGLAKYFSEYDAKSRALTEAREELKNLQQRIAENEAEAGESKSTNEKLSGLLAMYDHLQNTKQPLVDSVLELEAKKKAILVAFRDMVTDIRGKSVGMQWADVPYKNGQVLREVRIQKVMDEEITLAHGEGVAKLRNDDLPPELKSRFRIGMEPFLSDPNEGSALPQTASAGTGPAPKPTGNPATPAVPLAVGPDPDVIEEQIIASNEKIRSLEVSRNQYQDRAAGLRYQAATAKANGRPSYTTTKEAAEAEQQMTALNAQLEKLRADNAALRGKFTKATADRLAARRAAEREAYNLQRKPKAKP